MALYPGNLDKRLREVESPGFQSTIDESSWSANGADDISVGFLNDAASILRSLPIQCRQ
ncbi:hypothetical protein Rmet_6697 (plasmid) [Cupriavidus metallidurans CH34]|uniref:Uncharacterized protein n=1 Tax=Cupriavidus metallidurans (strain ATCC 43123 / DSM 2839 / NBRC 102507 / CH34) TaxID=266264 RepID=D3DYB0_CUPMC|nr:hypothetical protein Rmet_6697 [Cupriavidus metallidurans CH34]